jgi:hypothetical protein
MRFTLSSVLAVLLSASFCVAVENAATVPANSDPTYQALRHIAVAGGAYSVNQLTLKRDAGKFIFKSGTFYLLSPVNGKTTGAVFVGDGEFTLDPPTAAERHSLSYLTHSPEFSESFSEMVLRFTDDSEQEIKKNATPANTSYNGGYFEDIRGALKGKLHYNLDARILEDVLSERTGGLFVAFIRGKNYSSKMIYVVDPFGADAFLDEPVAPDEVALVTYDDNLTGVWTAFRSSSATAANNNEIHIDQQKLNTQIDKGAYLNGDAATSFTAQTDGVRVVPFDLFDGLGDREGLRAEVAGLGGSLRVKSVSDASGAPLAFIQEEKGNDPQFFVILPAALHKGESATVRVIYGGKDAVMKTGEGNYYPVAREDWYPNVINFSLGNYAMYDMTFRVPKGMTFIATGSMVDQSTEGDWSISHWKTDVPMTVAGFNFGKFKHDEAKLDKESFTVDSYANEDDPDFVKALKHYAEGNGQFGGSMLGNGEAEGAGLGSLGLMDTTQMMKKALSEGQLSVKIYTDYFGPSSYHHVAISQQTAVNYGQSWPELVYLPITSFFDETTRHQLGMGNADTRGYFRVVGPHEVAHQWWGHTVGFGSYRDQWMSEGFADFSASLFLQNVYGMAKFREFWDDERWLLTTADAQGVRGADVPVVMGYRAANSKTGWGLPREVIYPKGAYILHMIRMMMFDQKTGDEAFKAMMHDFVETYRNKPATTEDFKAMVEKHMTPAMDLDGNHKMDWFFNEFVYGTALPHYHVESSFTNSDKGMVMNLKVVQSGVDQNFKMLVPLYIEFPKDKVVRFGSARIMGNNTIQQQIPIGHVPETPQKAVVNYLNDVLSVND